jgi:PadR family transcriptional regulator PadR
MKLLSRVEEIMLLSILKLQDNAYGVTIRKLIFEVTGKRWSIGAIYVPLERLEHKGFVESYTGEPTEMRGGRSKRMYRVTREGLRALEEIKELNKTLWESYSEWVL